MTHDELVEKMIEAWADARHENNVVDSARERMSAALRVAVEEVLQDPPNSEIPRTSLHGVAWEDHACQAVRDTFRNRRSRYLKPKSAEERVTISACNVLIDGERVAIAENVAFACMIMNGLIQQLKEGKQ